MNGQSKIVTPNSSVKFKLLSSSSSSSSLLSTTSVGSNNNLNGRLPDFDYQRKCAQNIEEDNHYLIDYLVLQWVNPNQTSDIGLILREQKYYRGDSEGTGNQKEVTDVYVDKIKPYGCAQRSKLCPNDQITQIDNCIVSSKAHALQIFHQLTDGASVYVLRPQFILTSQTLFQQYQRPYLFHSQFHTTLTESPVSLYNQISTTNGQYLKSTISLQQHLLQTLVEKKKKSKYQPKSDTAATAAAAAITTTTATTTAETTTAAATAAAAAATMTTMAVNTTGKIACTEKVNKRVEEKLPETCEKVISSRNSDQQSQWIVRKRSNGIRYITKRLKESDNRYHPRRRLIIPGRMTSSERFSESSSDHHSMLSEPQSSHQPKYNQSKRQSKQIINQPTVDDNDRCLLSQQSPARSMKDSSFIENFLNDEKLLSVLTI